MSRFTSFVDDYIYNNDLYDQISEDKTYKSVYNKVIREHNNNIRSIEEYNEIAEKIINVIKKEYNLHLLRVYAYHPYIATKGYVGFDLHDLYENTIQEMQKTVNAILYVLDITEKEDKQLLEIFFKDAFHQKYGFIIPNIRLETIITMIHEHNYDPQFVAVLSEDLKYELKRSKDKYFYKQDLTDEKVLCELYTIIGENVGFFEFRESIFYDYDGYGHLVCNAH